MDCRSRSRFRGPWRRGSAPVASTLSRTKRSRARPTESLASQRRSGRLPANVRDNRILNSGTLPPRPSVRNSETQLLPGTIVSASSDRHVSKHYGAKPCELTDKGIFSLTSLLPPGSPNSSTRARHQGQQSSSLTAQHSRRRSASRFSIRTRLRGTPTVMCSISQRVIFTQISHERSVGRNELRPDCLEHDLARSVACITVLEGFARASER
jgi:hypothetical protein